MLLRSSSTPILGSLLSSSSYYFSESPINNYHHTSSSSSSCFPHQPNPTFQSFSCNYSPLSDSSDRDPSAFGFRRTRSDGNLQDLVTEHPDDSHHSHSVRSSFRRANPVLETIPSFCRYNSNEEVEEEEEEEEEEIAICGINQEFSFLGKKGNMGLDENAGGIGGVSGCMTPPLFLARGLGIDQLDSGFINGGGGGGGGANYSVLTDNGGDRSDMETFYRRMLEENPNNALFLRNYAQFLYQSKGDPQRAEEYYSRAILAEPGDGEILSQYAKVVWELHRDEERAASYFEQAVQAAPQDSHVLAAYAGFLWDTEGDDGDGRGEDTQSQDYGEALVSRGALASARA